MPATGNQVDISNMRAEEARLWALYCDNRDAIAAIHADCLNNNARSPRLVFLFCATKCQWRTYKPPVFVWPSRRIKFLKAAVDFTQYVLDNPGGKSNQDMGPK